MEVDEEEDYVEMRIDPNRLNVSYDEPEDDDCIMEESLNMSVEEKGRLEKIVDENLALSSYQIWKKIYDVEGKFINYQIEVSNLFGRLELCSNNISAILVDAGYKLKCIIKDLAIQLDKCLLAHMRAVKIKRGTLVIERFQLLDDEPLTFVSLITSYEDIQLLNEYFIKIEKPMEDTWRQLFLVQHVSTPFYLSEEPICFVLVGFLIKEKPEEMRDLWLILKRNQVAWKDLLIPNREYLMLLPLTVPQDYFSRQQKFLNTLIDDNNLLKHIMHHPYELPSVQGVAVPDNVTLYLQSNSDLSIKEIPREFPFLPRDAVYFKSLRDANYSNKKILSVFGLIKSIEYEVPVQTGGCVLCPTGGKGIDWPIGPPSPHKWINPWITSITLSETVPKIGIALPNVNSSDTPFIGFIPENLTQKIVLEDAVGIEVTLYIKNWKHFIRPMGLNPGVFLLAKFVIRRVSQTKKLYFMACPLSSFQILNDRCESNIPWGCVGFPELETRVNDRSWGVLDFENLLKAEIKFTCRNCNNENNCLRKFRKQCCPTISAFAAVMLPSVQGSIKLYFFGDNVRKYLSVDQCLWDKFTTSAKEAELNYFFRYKRTEANCDPSNIAHIFQLYCSIMRPIGKRFISVKRIGPTVKNSPIRMPIEYTCLQIEPVIKPRMKTEKSERLITDFNNSLDV